jgi:hypothetical protein
MLLYQANNAVLTGENEHQRRKTMCDKITSLIQRRIFHDKHDIAANFDSG